jgi:hypothetical protein
MNETVMEKSFIDSIERLKKSQLELSEIISGGENVMDRMCYRKKLDNPMSSEAKSSPDPQNHVEALEKIAKDNQVLVKRLNDLITRIDQTI